jgi:hypothetical protein
VLIRSANVSSYDLKDNAVVAFALLLGKLKLWVSQVFNCDHARAFINNAAIAFSGRSECSLNKLAKHLYRVFLVYKF